MPAFASSNPVYGTAFLNSLLNAYKTTAAGPLVATAKVRLNTNPAFNPGAGDTIADNVANEADFSGYPAGGIAVVLSAPVNLSTTCQGSLFNATYTAAAATPFVTGTAYGYWVDDGTNVIMGEKFGAGINFAFGVPGDFLELIGQMPQQAYQATL